MKDQQTNAKAEKKFRFTPIRWGCKAAGAFGYGVGAVVGTVLRIPVSLTVGVSAGFKSEIVKKA
jgi:hypothetical protein